MKDQVNNFFSYLRSYIPFSQSPVRTEPQSSYWANFFTPQTPAEKDPRRFASILSTNLENTMKEAKDTMMGAKEAITEGAKSAADNLAEQARHAKDVISEGGKHAKEAITGRPKNTKDVIMEGAQHAKDMLSERAHQAKESLTEGAHYAKETLAGGAQHAKEAISERAHHARESISQPAQAMKTAAIGLSSKFSNRMSSMSKSVTAAIPPLVLQTLVMGYIAAFLLTAWHFTIGRGKGVARAAQRVAEKTSPSEKQKGARILPTGGDQRAMTSQGPIKNLPNTARWLAFALYAICALINYRRWRNFSAAHKAGFGAPEFRTVPDFAQYPPSFSATRFLTECLALVMGYASAYLLYESYTAPLHGRAKAKPGLPAARRGTHMSWNPALPLVLFNAALCLNIPYMGSYLAMLLTLYLSFVRPLVVSTGSFQGAMEQVAASARNWAKNAQENLNKNRKKLQEQVEHGKEEISHAGQRLKENVHHVINEDETIGHAAATAANVAKSAASAATEAASHLASQAKKKISDVAKQVLPTQSYSDTRQKEHAQISPSAGESPQPIKKPYGSSSVTERETSPRHPSGTQHGKMREGREDMTAASESTSASPQRSEAERKTVKQKDKLIEDDKQRPQVGGMVA